MKVLYSRITKAIKAKPKIESLCDDLTLIGIEVDEIKSIQGDKIIDFDLTPNRGDCFSVRGLARDYCAFKGKKFSSVTKNSFKGEKKFNKKIKLEVSRLYKKDFKSGWNPIHPSLSGYCEFCHVGKWSAHARL